MVGSEADRTRNERVPNRGRLRIITISSTLAIRNFRHLLRLLQAQLRHSSHAKCHVLRSMSVERNPEMSGKYGRNASRGQDLGGKQQRRVEGEDTG